jgi:hypothetical protein
MAIPETSKASSFSSDGSSEPALKKSTDAEICSFCLEDMTQDGPTSVLSCGHTFHLNCVLIWRGAARRSDSDIFVKPELRCPLCRLDVSREVRRLRSSKVDTERAALLREQGVHPLLAEEDPSTLSAILNAVRLRRHLLDKICTRELIVHVDAEKMLQAMLRSQTRELRLSRDLGTALQLLHSFEGVADLEEEQNELLDLMTESDSWKTMILSSREDNWSSVDIMNEATHIFSEDLAVAAKIMNRAGLDLRRELCKSCQDRNNCSRQVRALVGELWGWLGDVDFRTLLRERSRSQTPRAASWIATGVRQRCSWLMSAPIPILTEMEASLDSE